MRESFLRCPMKAREKFSFIVSGVQPIGCRFDFPKWSWNQISMPMVILTILHYCYLGNETFFKYSALRNISFLLLQFPFYNSTVDKYNHFHGSLIKWCTIKEDKYLEKLFFCCVIFNLILWNISLYSFHDRSSTMPQQK